MTADCFHLNNDSGCLKGLKSRSVWRETERKGKGQRGWSRRKDGNKREEEEEEEMRRGEREVEEEEEEIQKPHSHQQDGVTPGLLILSKNKSINK